MSSMVYASTVVLRHPGEGEFARVLGPAPTGTRYRGESLDRASSTRAVRWTPEPIVREPKKERVPKPRWTQERLDALPKTSGLLTLVSHSELGAGTVTVTLSCAGPHERCDKVVVMPATKWAMEKRPRSCWFCAQKFRRAYNGPTSERGYAMAREHAAKLKEAAR